MIDKVDSLQEQMQVMLESIRSISAATIVMVPLVPLVQVQRPFRFRSIRRKKFGGYQGFKEHFVPREYRPRSRSNGTARTEGEDPSHQVRLASLANSNETTAGLHTPVMSIQESKEQGTAGAARAEVVEPTSKEDAEAPPTLNQTAPPYYGTAKKDTPVMVPTPLPDLKTEPEGRI